jgi:pimeloyl-ACP methyl ester carboxylesterase
VQRAQQGAGVALNSSPNTMHVLSSSVRYVPADNGVNIAWTAHGNGSPALVMVPGLFSHLALDWQDDAGWFHQRLAERFRLIRYDRPGCGLADRDLWDFTLEGQVDGLRRVIHDSGERRVALFASGLAAPAAIAFAAAHPDRVDHLVLFNAAPRLIASEDYPDGNDAALFRAAQSLVLADWSLAAHTLVHLFAPGSNTDTIDRLVAAWCSSMSSRAAADLLDQAMEIDVRHLLAKLVVPTLVLQRRDHFASVNNAYRLTEAIRGSELRLLDGSAHFPWHGNRSTVVRLVSDFVGRKQIPLTVREMDIMRAVQAGLSNREIGHQLNITAHTVARHLSNVFLKLNVSSRVAALAELRAAGGLEEDWRVEDQGAPSKAVSPRDGEGDKPQDVRLRVS